MKKWRNLFLATIGFIFCGCCALACSSKQVGAVHAEGEVVEVVQEEEQSKETKEWLKEKYETFIVPLLSGISIASVGSLLFTVVFLVTKTRLSEKRNRLIEARANEKYEQAQTTLLECKDILSKVNQVYELTCQVKTDNDTAKQFIEDKMKYMVAVIDKSSTQIGKVDDLIKVVTVSTQLQAKIAKQSPELVRSGIISDIDEVTNLVKRL